MIKRNILHVYLHPACASKSLLQSLGSNAGRALEQNSCFYVLLTSDANFQSEVCPGELGPQTPKHLSAFSVVDKGNI